MVPAFSEKFKIRDSMKNPGHVRQVQDRDKMIGKQ